MYFGHEEKKRAIIVIFSFVISLLLIAGGLILDAYGPISEFNYRTLTIAGLGCVSISIGLFILLNVTYGNFRIDWGVRDTIHGIGLIVFGLSIIWITLNF